MTVQTSTNVASFNGNGVTQIFPIAFKFNNDTDLVVLLVDDAAGTSSTLTLNSDYTVSGEGDEEGGLINVVTAPAAGKRLLVSRIVDILQLVDLRNQGKFFAEVHEDAFDLLTMIAQQHESAIKSALRVAESDPEPARIPPVALRAGKLLAFDEEGNPTIALPVADSSTALRQELGLDTGAGLIGMDLDGTYADGTLGKAILDALSTPKENAAWAGFFACWPMGHARTVNTAERVQLPAGVTHGRAGFAAGTTITHADGQKAADALRIQRNADDTDTSNHTACINLTAEETKPLRGKRCTMHLYARRGADYSGATITYRVQGSVEPEQPILSSVGNYTNGHEVLATANVLPGLNQPNTPYSLTFDVPSDMTQVAIVIVVRFAGTAGTNDFVELEDVSIYPGRRVYPVARPDFAALLNKAATRYQASYPYGVPVGSNTHQGAMTSIANGTAVNWAVHANVRFSPRMIAPPRVQFLAPSSGIRSRWLNPAAGTFLSGIAFDVSDSGVSITNNAAAVDGTRYLCQWVADVLF